MINSRKVHFAFVMPWHISERGGGAEVQANYLAQDLAKRGHSVSYICQTKLLSKINSIERIGNINVHFLKPSGKFQWLDQNKYYESLNTLQPDYILQRLSSNVTYVLGKYKSRNNCKFIWFCTDNKSPFSDFHFAKFEELYTLKSLGILKYGIFAFSNKLMDYYRNTGMKQVDMAFSQNEFQKGCLKSNFNLESFRINSGHPMPSKVIRVRERFEKQTILWCANFGKHKRPELFIELASKMDQTSYKFVMVGGHSNQQYVNKLLEGGPKNLVITGKLSFEQALKHFDEATLFVNTSAPGGDGFPNTFIQSWLRQVPVISFGFDPDRIIEINNLGLIVTTVKNATEQIESVLKNYNSYRMLSNNAFNYAQENHSIKQMADNFLNVVDH